jgi:hypothetical protein
MSSDEPRNKDPFLFEKPVRCVHTTADAVKVTPLPPHTAAAFWVPQSVIHDDSEVHSRGTEGKLIVMHWFAEEQGWTRTKVPLKLKPKGKS